MYFIPVNENIHIALAENLKSLTWSLAWICLDSSAPEILGGYVKTRKVFLPIHASHHADKRIQSAYSRKLLYRCRYLCEQRSRSLIFAYFSHDDVIKWNYFPREWPLVRGIHQSPVNSPHKDQWRALWCFLWSKYLGFFQETIWYHRIYPFSYV